MIHFSIPMEDATAPTVRAKAVSVRRKEVTDYNPHWDRCQDDEEPRWLPFLAIMAFAAVIMVGGAIANLGQAGIAKVRGWA